MSKSLGIKYQGIKIISLEQKLLIILSQSQFSCVLYNHVCGKWQLVFCHSVNGVAYLP